MRTVKPGMVGLWAVLVGIGACCCTTGLGQEAGGQTTRPAEVANLTKRGEAVILPSRLLDPMEPLNRAMWGFNKGLMTHVIKPSAKVYRFIVRKPVREGIANFGQNIEYPRKLVNNLLQQRWAGARDETYRFGCNTVLGLAGFIDVASRLDIPKSDADFGQTLGTWGWRPRYFVMLPFYGPSSGRDTLGLAVDTAMNPLNYLSPYPSVPDNPVTYLGPYTYASYAVTYNNLSDSVDKYVRLSQASEDPYSQLKYLWGYTRDTRKPNFTVDGVQDQASLETLGSLFFGPTDPEFPGRGKTESAYVYTTGKRLPFTSWVHATPAPVAYIVPGLGSHRLADNALGLAELIYNSGFSVVCVSSPFNYEFMEQASSTALPGNAAEDAAELHVALAEIDQKLGKLHPGKLGARALLGYSMGGFETLCIAAEAASTPSLMHFDRYLAIDTPVRLLHGVSILDKFFDGPLVWPAAERSNRIENAFLKVAALMKAPPRPEEGLPFSSIESKFLVGAAFRMILRDTIYVSQAQHDQGVLQRPIRKYNREPVYREILQYSFDDYFRQFVTPYYQARSGETNLTDHLATAADLRAYETALHENQNVRAIVNQNDFLLADDDRNWLQGTLQNRLTIFPRGGHLGNLGHPAVQKAILAALEGLRETGRPKNENQ